MSYITKPQNNRIYWCLTIVWLTVTLVMPFMEQKFANKVMCRMPKSEQLACTKFEELLYGKKQCKSYNELRCEEVMKKVPLKCYHQTDKSLTLHVMSCYQLHVLILKTCGLSFNCRCWIWILWGSTWQNGIEAANEEPWWAFLIFASLLTLMNFHGQWNMISLNKKEILQYLPNTCCYILKSFAKVVTFPSLIQCPWQKFFQHITLIKSDKDFAKWMNH